MEANKNVTMNKKIEALWNSSQPYRAGFALGFLVVSLTLVLIFTGQKSQKLSFKASPRQSVSTPSSTVVSSSEPEYLGASTSSQPIGQKAPEKNNSVVPSIPAKAQTTKININTASLSLLDVLPQIGPVTAQRIIDYRTAHGAFKNINELDNVKGIGIKTIDKIRNLVTVE